MLQVDIKKSNTTFQTDFQLDTHISPSIAALVGEENLDTAIRPLVNEALLKLNGSEFPCCLKPEQLQSMSCAMSTQITNVSASPI